jgi:hypothetical protein
MDVKSAFLNGPIKE